jgi:G3E family GTPase
LLITKADLVDSNALAVLEQRLQQLNPLATIQTIQQGQIATAELVNLRRNAFSPTRLNVASFKVLEQIEQRTLGFSTQQGASKADKRIQSHVVQFHKPISLKRVKLGLMLVMGHCDQRLLRMKALLNTTEYANPVVLHAVQQLLFPEQVLESGSNEYKISQVVLITADMDESTLKPVLQEFRAIIEDKLE